MNETIEAPAPVAHKPRERVPHSEEVENAIINHLIKDVVTLPPARLKFPPKDESGKL